jgi:anthranilate phosphoribosyltransferase
LVRLLNPFDAQYSIQGIFHPSYRSVHQQAAALLQQPHMAVLKGEGGETERNPDMDCLVQSVHNGELSEEVWSALFTQRHVRAETLDSSRLPLMWQGKMTDEFAEGSIIGTTAVALKLLCKVETQPQAHELATQFWLERDKKRFG